MTPCSALRPVYTGRERGPITVRVPPPPIQAPQLCSMAAERDKSVGTRSLPCSPSHGAVLAALHCASSSLGEDRVSPHVSKMAYRPALTNTGWLNCRGAMGTAVEEEDEEEVEDELASPGGGGGG